MCICIDKTILILQTDEPINTKTSTLITTLISRMIDQCFMLIMSCTAVYDLLHIHNLHLNVDEEDDGEICADEGEICADEYIRCRHIKPLWSQ